MSEIYAKIDGLSSEIVAIRPVRCRPSHDDFRYYEAYTTKDEDKIGWVKMMLRRVQVCGGLLPNESKSNLLLDLLDNNGDIIDDFAVSKKGFEYLRKKLGFKVVTGRPSQ